MESKDTKGVKLAQGQYVTFGLKLDQIAALITNPPSTSFTISKKNKKKKKVCVKVTCDT